MGDRCQTRLATEISTRHGEARVLFFQILQGQKSQRAPYDARESLGLVPFPFSRLLLATQTLFSARKSILDRQAVVLDQETP